jgi:DNA replication protein DnaC
MLISSGKTLREVMAMPDGEILRNAETLFCDCDTGRALLAMVARRNADFMQWLKTTETAQREAAARIAAGAFGMAGIPDRFRNATWAAMRNRCEKDAGKKEALLLTYRLLQDGYIERHGVRKKSLLLWSKQRGVGKTYLATAVFKQAIKNRPGLWIWFHRLVESVRAGYNGNGDAYKLLAQARDIDVLLLDELGHNWRDDATAHTVEVLHSVLFYRHAYDMPTIFTSNKSPDELATMFGEEHWQRIGEMAVIIEMGGETLRELG